MNELAIYMPTGKVAKQQLEGQLRSMYLSGDFDPLDIEIKVKGVSDAIEAVRKDPEVRDAVMDALSLYNEKTIELEGAKVQKRLTPARYIFSECGDPEWSKLDAQIKALTEQRKDREGFLKSLKKMEVIVDQDTGEAVEVQPPIKTQGETLAITFK